MSRALGLAIVTVSTLALGWVTYAGVRAYQGEAPEPDGLDTCCALDGAPRRAPSAIVPSDLSGGAASAGRDTYRLACANCHGDVLAVPDAPRDLAEVIVRGRGKMPAFGGLIEGADLENLIAYVHGMRPP